ncbi:succinyldiaminopimelate transaminase [Alkalimarinus alittae]|uniref:Succinyldiaminopimelate transaminase n=1 Tax=Alkalimarinus alittae TaxID=2961619 RepID=A0ABY6MZ41_9ALTE|nr:succinyldiaminopimelate transaminase [Alkalimarinus alittae]UZE95093.1 succinyldiaminopimelate transaminase [Alkalimarinus alittae]
MNSDLNKLQPYPFEKLNQLKSEVTPSSDYSHIALSIGEPKHASPRFVLDELTKQLGKLSIYPSTKGIPELRESICNWLTQRFKLTPASLDPEQHVLPVNGTREAIFSLTQALIDRPVNNMSQSDATPLVVCPNPFYQIYEGAAFLSGAEPHFLPCLEVNNYIPDFEAVSPDVWQRCQLLFLCSPGNPTGAVIPSSTLQRLIALADQYDFIIASDECYSEIYCDESRAPIGLLQACAEMNRNDYKRCVVFHSLSKRSNLPGLRSGFVAGDASIMEQFLRYRTYHGSAMPIQHQLASIAAWNDETHVKENRSFYREKFATVMPILGEVMDVAQTDASFYLWLKTPIQDDLFAQKLFQEKHVTVLPGRYLSRTVNGINPGENRVRLALVAPLEECIEAAERIRDFVKGLEK